MTPQSQFPNTANNFLSALVCATFLAMPGDAYPAEIGSPLSFPGAGAGAA